MESHRDFSVRRQEREGTVFATGVPVWFVPPVKLFKASFSCQQHHSALSEDAASGQTLGLSTSAFESSSLVVAKASTHFTFHCIDFTQRVNYSFHFQLSRSLERIYRTNRGIIVRRGLPARSFIYLPDASPFILVSLGSNSLKSTAAKHIYNNSRPWDHRKLLTWHR